ncbi:MAG: type VI secretion system membrane subunit TssM [Gammaproteobacteria bacterium]|nr:type VI secretion system membrane subunit TssM [Gammaproteobacteria bacterium]
MKSVLHFLTQRWFVTLIGALVLCCVIWFFGAEVQFGGNAVLESSVSRILSMAAVLGVWALVSFVRYYRSSKASDALISGIAQPDESTNPALDAAEEEIDELRGRLGQATDALKQHFGRVGQKNLYELPWYMIIGPPGSGKTTLLANSELKFSLEEQFGRADVKGVGGTRNCDWSFTDEAVFLDTAGRYTTQDSHAEVDREAWLGFLQMLRKARPRRPINALIVAIGLNELVGLGEAQRQAHARAISDRIHELHEELGVRLPIYVIVTKCDLLSGFVEFFSDLSRDEWRQVWGITFDEGLDTSGSGIRDAFQTDFEAFLERLKSRSLRRLNDERETYRCVSLHGFPWQVQSVGPLVGQFLADTFGASRYQKHPPLLRGVYLTSATQEGTPFDALLSSVAQSFGIDAGAVASVGMGGEGRSYFISDVLHRVVFPESELAGVNRKVEKRRAWLQKFAYIGTAAATVMAAVAWFFSYQGNSSYVGEVADAVAAHEKAVGDFDGTTVDFASVLPRLEAARKVWTTASQYDADGPPLRLRMLLYQGNGLGDAARDAYQRELNSLLTPQLTRELALDLTRPEADLVERYEGLGQYVSFANQDSGERQTERSIEYFQGKWDGLGDPTSSGRLSTHLEALLSQQVHAAGTDENILEQVRETIRGSEGELLALQLVKALEKGKNPTRAFVAYRDIPLAEEIFHRTREGPLANPISPAYTRKGLIEALLPVKGRLAQVSARFGREAKTLGIRAYGKTELELFEDSARKAYVERYIAEWREFLRALKLKPMSSRREVIELLEWAIGQSSPLRTALNVVARDTAVGDAIKLPPGIESIDRLQGSLRRLEGAFEDVHLLMRRPDGGGSRYDNVEKLLADLYEHLSGLEVGDLVKPGIYGSIRREWARRPEPVKGWLKDISASSKGITKQYIEDQKTEEERERAKSIRKEINNAWKGEVLRVCRQTVSRAFPFDVRSSDDVPIDDFGQLFSPNGLLASFFEASLQPYVDSSGSVWRWRDADGVNLGISNDKLRSFAFADQIQRAFFPKRTDTPAVEFILKPQLLDSKVKTFTLTVDSNPAVVYRAGPEFESTIKWPGGGDGAGPGRVLLSIDPRDGAAVRWSYEGPWAWLRALTSVDATDPNRVIALFSRGGYEVKYTISTKSSRHPLNGTTRKALAEFKCVDRF